MPSPSKRSTTDLEMHRPRGYVAGNCEVVAGWDATRVGTAVAGTKALLGLNSTSRPTRTDVVAVPLDRQWLTPTRPAFPLPFPPTVAADADSVGSAPRSVLRLSERLPGNSPFFLETRCLENRLMR